MTLRKINQKTYTRQIVGEKYVEDCPLVGTVNYMYVTLCMTCNHHKGIHRPDLSKPDEFIDCIYPASVYAIGGKRTNLKEAVPG